MVFGIFREREFGFCDSQKRVSYNGLGGSIEQQKTVGGQFVFIGFDLNIMMISAL